MFTRLSIDLDVAGNVVGCSYEHHDTDGPTTIWVGSPGPFDTPEEALQSALAAHLDWVGVQAALF